MQNEEARHCTVLLLSKIDQNGVFSLLRLKHFEAYFYFVVLSISFSNFLISNKYYLLLKHLTVRGNINYLFFYMQKNIIPLRNDFQLC